MFNYDRLLDCLRAIAEPTRLRLLAVCAGGELTVGEIAEVVGQSQPRVSRHLKLLCEAGLLARFREQHWVYYRLAGKGEGAALARQLLPLLDPADPVLALDRQRTEAVLGERSRRAARLLDQHAEWKPDAWAEDAIASAILQSVDTTRIGELVDIGTGTGRILRVLGPYAAQAVGIDLSRDMRLLARARLHEAGLDHCTVRHADMYRLPFASGSFDTVTIDQVLGEAQAPAAAVAEAARLLRPGGQMLLIELTGQGTGPTVGREEVVGWLAAAGLRCEHQRRLKSRAGSMTLFVARGGDPVQQAA